MVFVTAAGHALFCESDCRAHLRTLPHRFYVYILHKPDGMPFYVGKGVDERVFHHLREARNHPNRLTHKLNTIRAIERQGHRVAFSIAGTFAVESDAQLFEVELIRKFGRFDLGFGPLTNQTDGGEGAVNLSPETLARKLASLAGEDAENEERRIANRFFNALLDVGSVPIKQLGSLAFESLTPHPSPRQPTPRQAAALAASAISNRVMIEDGALIPRGMSLEGVQFVVENGVGRDILKSGLAVLVPAAVPAFEVFRLTALGRDTILSNLNKDILISGGVLAEYV